MSPLRGIAAILFAFSMITFAYTGYELGPIERDYSQRFYNFSVAQAELSRIGMNTSIYGINSIEEFDPGFESSKALYLRSSGNYIIMIFFVFIMATIYLLTFLVEVRREKRQLPHRKDQQESQDHGP